VQFRLFTTGTDLSADRRHVHVLRHSAAVHVLDGGEDIDFARDHLGHRSIQSTMAYAQISDARRNRTLTSSREVTRVSHSFLAIFFPRYEDDPVWRAAAFLLERGYRERWGKKEPQQSSVTITLTDEQLAVLTEGLPYVQARDATPPIEAQATNGSGETPPKG
jgi:hypothetical protein